MATWRPFITNIVGLSGAVESGGLLFSYVKGTSTPRPLYTDEGVTPDTNPSEADSLGQISVYFDSELSYTWTAKTADEATTLWTVNVVGGILSITYINPDYDVHPIIEASWVPALQAPLGEGWSTLFGQDTSRIELESEDIESVLRVNYNPDGLEWTDGALNGKSNFTGIFWDIGGYGDISFGDVTGEITGIVGATRIPSNAQTGGKALSGYARTSSPDGPAIGVFAYGKSDAAASLAWAFNSVTEAGDHATTVWGDETDLNVVNVNTVVLGKDVTGGSSVEPELSIGYRLAAINPFVTPKRRWTIGFSCTDASALVAFDIGTESEDALSGSMPIDLYARDVSNNRYKAGQFLHDGAGTVIRTAQASGLVKIQSRNAGGVLQDNLLLFQQNTGIGYTGGLPLYAAHVGGDVVSTPSASVTPTNNGEMVVQKTSNTRVTRKVKGSDGTVRTRVEGLSSAGVQGPTVQVFTSSGTYTPPEGLVAVIVEVRGGGGGGGGVGNAAGYFAGGGGAQGGYSRKRILASDLGATEAVTVGSGGTAGANTGGDGGTGGTSSFGSHCSATGGTGGGGVTTAGAIGTGRAGGLGSSGDANHKGAAGSNAIAITAQSTAISGCGGGEGGAQGRSVSNPGLDGANGGGGSGAITANASTGNAGGAGGAGYVIVTEYYA